MSLSDTTFTILDCETTGLHSDYGDKIIEIALISCKFENGQFVTLDSFETLVNPGQELEPAVAMLTGISQQDLLGAPKMDEVREKIQPFLQHQIMVGHNVAFDLGFLTSSGFTVDKPSIDTLDLASVFEGGGDSISLESLSNRYGIDHNSHRAMGDVLATKEILGLYIQKIQALPTETLQIIQHVLPRADWAGKILFPETPKLAALPDLISKLIHQIQTNLKKPAAQLDPKDITIQEHKKELYDTIVEKLEQHGKAVIETSPGGGKTYLSLKAAVNFYQRSKEKVLYLFPFGSHDIIESEALVQQEFPDHTVLFQNADKIVSLPQLFAVVSSDREMPKDEVLLVIKIVSWVSETRTGYLSELNMLGSQRVYLPLWNDEVEHAMLKTWPDLFIDQYYQRMKQAGVVLISYYDYFSTIKQTPEDLTAYQAYIFENGTILEDQLIYAATNSLSMSRLNGLVQALEQDLSNKNMLENGHKKLVEELKNTTAFLFSYLGMHAHKHQEEQEQSEILLSAKDMVSSDFVKVRDATEHVLEIFQKVRKIYAEQKLNFTLESNTQRFESLLQELLSLPAGKILYLQLTQDDTVLLKSVQLDIESLFQSWTKNKSTILILNSPVIDIKKRLGLEQFEKITMSKKTAAPLITYVTEDIKADSTYKYTQELIGIIQNILPQRSEKLIFIMSSIRLLQQAVLGAATFLKEHKIDYIAQKISGGETKILEKYQRLGGAPVLFCTTDFFLKLNPRKLAADTFVIQKLPFVATSGLIDTLRKQKMNNAFLEFALPKSLYRFEEMVGHISKVPTSHKRLFLLDNKIVTENYGEYFRQLLPSQEQLFVCKKEELGEIMKEKQE